ncbi:Uncharacterised protein [Vibrio cholerae]|nr:Uncharacterised protein [Vibrio cholerae]
MDDVIIHAGLANLNQIGKRISVTVWATDFHIQHLL